MDAQPTQPPSSGPLAGVRILDLSRILSGPFATMIFADLGAEVIKVEQPGRGDFMREIGPFVDAGEPDGQYSLFWAVEGRGRKSVTLDLRTAQGQELLRGLAATSDVLVENFRPGTLEQWNIDPSRLSDRLVTVRITMFGQDGPYAPRPGLDRVGIGYGGLLHLTGYPDRPPVRVGVTISDYLTGVFAAHAAVAVENARLFEESQRLVAQVQSMQRQRDLFFAMMNHELRNALTGVYGWAELLVRGKPRDAVPQEAREVYEAAERTIELLNNFLDLTRLDAGKVRPVFRDVEALTSIERAFASVSPSATAKDISLEHRGEAASVVLRTDPVRLEQILLNLLSNAVRHSMAAVPVTVDVTRADRWVQFRVTDRGPGVPAGLVERIFEPFERFDPHSGLGTGLGLPVSRRLAEVLGGSLRVERADSTGSTFLLELPVDADG